MDNQNNDLLRRLHEAEQGRDTALRAISFLVAAAALLLWLYGA